MTKSRRLRAENGVAMTEFALVIPVFLVVVAGLLAFGRVFFYWIEANHLANETARWAAVDRRPDPSKTLQQYARDSGGTVEFSDAKICIVVPGGAPQRSEGRSGEDLQAVLVRPDPRDRKVTIRGDATMRIERFGDGTAPTTVSTNVGSPFGACT